MKNKQTEEVVHKSFGFEFKAEDVNNDEGIIVGYGATYNVIDGWGDVILPNAFTKCLMTKKSFPLLYQHDLNLQIGVVTVQEDAYGLKMEAKYYLNTALGKEKFELAKANAEAGLINTEFSIGYRATKFKRGEFEGMDCRYLEEICLKEISQVTIAANSDAIALSIKNDINVREIETKLREAGLSKSQATKWSSQIKSSLVELSDSANEEQSDSVKETIVEDENENKNEDTINELKSFFDEQNLILKLKNGMI